MPRHTKKCREKWIIRSYGFYYCPVHDSNIDWEDEFIDGMKRIWKNEGKTCLYCRHLKDLFDSLCLAFPEVIPSPLLTGMERHKKPWAQQKNKIVFSPRVFKRPPKIKYPKCPDCANSRIAKFQYGFPIFSAKLKKQIKEGSIILGGCEIDPSNPDFKCRDCGKEFGRINKGGFK